MAENMAFNMNKLNMAEKIIECQSDTELRCFGSGD